jgi:hypothetical protein
MTTPWKTVAIGLIALVLNAEFARADLRVTPAFVELQIEDGRASGSFVLANSAATPLRIRANLVHFAPDQDGRIKPAPMDSLSVSNWIKLNPKEFTIGPNEDRQIRFALVAPSGLPAGSYTGGIEFRPITAADTSSVSQVHAVQVIGVPILADNGTLTYQWGLLNDSTHAEITPRGVQVYCLLTNDGNGRIPQRGQWTLKDATGTVVRTGETSRLSIFPRTHRYFVTTLPPDTPAGTYEFSIVYTSDGDGSTLSGSSQVEIPDKLPEPPVNERKH